MKLFGWTEFSTETDSPRREIVPTEPPRSGDVVHPPPPRAARTPATRVRNAVLQADQLNLGGDPMAGRAKGEIPEVVTVQFNHNSRSIRKELVKVSQQGATTLQIVGSMNHPSAHDLLREALRLSFPRVVLTGDICGLESLPKNKLFQLRDFDEIWVPTTANNIELANRIHTITKVPVRHYGVLQSPLQEWANRWEREEFIGTPHFAVHPQESIIDLREEFLHFPDCPEKDAIAAALSDFPNAHGGALIDAWPTLPPLTVE
ncbi:MAG: hypothetical protein CL930_13775 [Deltaproteobacteria bacterium]|nr:hypothetical protein [Deltaproteobacteria bacterium]